ncbi:hypothetical protein J3R30DRAFT_3694660 [Lentinula aciculospora]|uniref:DUF6534 domain-containing protein n=1 Tax=Lentinula aciculospora TaxID=153920 RepID=A0A9W9DYZ5_9AGAR|nr:hypothetical protein J3R30DRAFT_3694660 [Lentinula aciculospora]
MNWELNGLHFAINVGETYGGMMVGLLLSSLLCGIASIQAAIFFCSKKTDPISHKLLVGILWALDVLQLCFVFNATYFYVVDQVGISSPPFFWSFKIQIFMQTLIMSLTKLLYISRLWKLKKFVSKWVPIGLGFYLVADCALGTVFAYEVYTVRVLHDLLAMNYKPIIILSMCSTSVSDLLVGGTLIYALAKSNTNLSWTNSSFEIFVAYLVNTGIITGLFSVAVLIALFAIGVQHPVYIVSEIALPQLYINCFLSMLNASVYFQTNQNSRGPTMTHILPYLHNEDPTNAILSRSDAQTLVSSESIMNNHIKLSEMETSNDNSPTINEIGLPLFQVENRPQPVVNVVRQKPVEVVIQRTQHAVTTDIRNGHGRVEPSCVGHNIV